MRILIANDDGVLAPGLAALHGALDGYADCVVVAPHEDRSGASSALTLDKPLRPFYLDNGFVGLNGTPTDCVHLGVNALFPDSVDMVVAGINMGANLGDDVLYSGTVAAALEGRFLHNPAMAFSLVSRKPDNLPAAAAIARTLVEAHGQLELPARTILNVNIPDLPLDQIKGIVLTRMGHRRRAAKPVKWTDPRGKEGYWISVAGDAEDGGEGTDFNAVMHGYVSVTPLRIDKTYFEVFDQLDSWLGSLKVNYGA